MKYKSPCFKCEKRALGCHATCEDYIEFKKLSYEENSLRRKAADDNNYSHERAARLFGKRRKK